MYQMLNKIRETRRSIIAAFCLAHIIYIVLVFRFLADRPVWRDILFGSAGIIHPTLLFNLAALLLIVGGIMLRAGKLRPADIGLQRSGAGAALAVTFLVWSITQIVLLGGSLFPGNPVSLNAQLSDPGVTFLTGGFIAQLLGNALYEEVAFRGFLLPQLYRKIRRPDGGQRRFVLAAILVSQAFFTVIHIPGYIHKGYDLLFPLLSVFLAGLLFALLYLRTGNLLMVVGLHALSNKPLPLPASPIPAQAVIVVQIIVLLVVWPYIRRWFSPRTSDSIAEHSR